MFQYTCFNIFHQLYNFGRGRYGQHFVWPNNQSLNDLFEYYEDTLWYYAGSTFQAEVERQNFIIGWHRIITNRSYGKQKFVPAEIQLDHVERFKTMVASTMEEIQ